MFDRDPQQRLDELTEDDLAGHRLRGLEHRPDIQLLDWRTNSSWWEMPGLLRRGDADAVCSSCRTLPIAPQRR